MLADDLGVRFKGCRLRGGVVVKVNGGVVASVVGLALVVGGVTGPAISAQAATAVPVTPAGLPAGIEALSGYVPAVSCDTKDKPGSTKLGQFLKGRYAGTSYGISRACGSDGMSTTEHYDGRAVDWMTNSRVPQQKANATAVIKWALATDKAGNTYANARRLGIMYMIYNNKIWGSYKAGLGWQPYQGCDTPAKASTSYDTACHRNHIHFSLSWAGAMGRTSFWTKKVAAPDYGPCKVAGLNWAPAYVGPRSTPCPAVATVRAEAGSSALHVALVSTSGMAARSGLSGPVVVNVQKMVGAGADGAFGPVTQAKVKAFQVAQRVPATGVMDVATWRAGLRVTAPRAVVTVSRAAVRAPVKYRFAAYLNVVLRRGSTGAVVKVLQKAVGAAADGDFGPLTEAKVRAFEAAHRLPVNGVVTAPVWRAFG